MAYHLNKNILEIPDWFELCKYNDLKTIDPYNLAWQLLRRKFILSELDNSNGKSNFKKEHIINMFDNIKKNGINKSGWEFPAYNAKYPQGVSSPSTSLHRANQTVKIIHKITQGYLDNGFITESVEVIDFEGFVDYFNQIDKCLLDSLEYKDELWHDSNNQKLSEYELELILKTTDLFHNVVDTRNQILIEIDLSTSDENIRKDFNNVLRALRTKDISTPLNIKALTIRNWQNRLNNIIKSKIFPYLDLLIHSKLTNQEYTFEDYDQLLYGEDVKSSKTRKTTKPNAEKSLKQDYIEALMKFYSIKKPEFWKSRSKSQKITK